VLPLDDIIGSYNPDAPLAEASTIPAAWYTDARVLDLERKRVFWRTWQAAGRVEQVRRPGQYVTWDLAGAPIVVVRGNDGVLRGFFNVCRHHAAAVMTEQAGEAALLRCPYHGWTYSLEGELKGTPDFSGVRDFDRTSMGLVRVETAVWEKWVLVRLAPGGPPHVEIPDLNIAGLRWFERRMYTLDCNWKIFVDNYLDGGYHVPHLHKGLDAALDYSEYKIENGDRYCLQSSPMVRNNLEGRGGQRALYYWIYPNFMINIYEGVMDTNLVIPRGVDKTDVVFDFYFKDASEEARDRNLASIAVSEKIQEEDVSICASVQRGLSSGAYDAGRLAVRREAGEHLFHRLLYADLRKMGS
jgi:choline monooxygenase